MTDQELKRPRVLAAVDDIFFSAKIEAAARHAGVDLRVVIDSAQLETALAGSPPDLIIFDLNGKSCAPLEAIRRIKGDAGLSRVRLLGFLSHVQVDLERIARQAGCDQVMPKSKFSATLPEMMRAIGESRDLP